MADDPCELPPEFKLTPDYRKIAFGVCGLAALAAFLFFVAYQIALVSSVPPYYPPQVQSDAAPQPPTVREPVLGFEVDTALPPGVGDKARPIVERTVVVSVQTRKGNLNFGSGFVLEDGVVVSAAHIIGGAEGDPLTVYCDGKPAEGSLLSADPVRDVMVIAVPECRGRRLKLDTRSAGPTEALGVAGYSFTRDLGQAKRYYGTALALPDDRFTPQAEDLEMVGRLKDMQRLKVPRLLAVRGTAARGNSGSPVFRGPDRIVGMLVITDPYMHRTFYVPARTIEYMLKEAGLR